MISVKEKYPEEYAAFEIYRDALNRLSADCTFENARAAKYAWIDFQNVYQADKLYPLNVTAFPAHRVVGASLPKPQKKGGK